MLRAAEDVAIAYLHIDGQDKRWMIGKKVANASMRTERRIGDREREL